jgi:hypothetical protein
MTGSRLFENLPALEDRTVIVRVQFRYIEAFSAGLRAGRLEVWPKEPPYQFDDDLAAWVAGYQMGEKHPARVVIDGY